MDRHVSSSLGLPMTVQDGDITTLLDVPASGLPTNPVLNLQVRLSRVHSFILNSMYYYQGSSFDIHITTH
jgi:proline utilization trans-activator